MLEDQQLHILITLDAYGAALDLNRFPILTDSGSTLETMKIAVAAGILRGSGLIRIDDKTLTATITDKGMALLNKWGGV